MAMVETKAIYICAPLKGEVETNIEKARCYARQVAGLGYLPVTPHLNFAGLFDDGISFERSTALFMCVRLLQRCDEVWVFGDKITEGMQTEIDLATEYKIAVKYVSCFG